MSEQRRSYVTAAFKERDFSDLIAAPPLTFTVRSFSKSAIGGCKLADIDVAGTEVNMWELVEFLRRPVEITATDTTEWLWSGYVAEVSIRIGSISFGVNIDSMYNRVAVVYGSISAGSTTPGVRATTSWAQDDTSVGYYGTKESMPAISNSTAGGADRIRDTYLATYKYPIPTVSIDVGSVSMSATLKCRGWFDTLRWKYYGNSNTTAVATTAQITAMVTAAGQFISSTSIANTSGISTSEYRDGDATAHAQIMELMKIGTSSNARLICDIDRDRRLNVYQEPANSSYNALMLNNKGRVLSYVGAEQPQYRAPVGQWIFLKDVLPATVDSSRLADPSAIFIEECEYDAISDRLRIHPRGVIAPYSTGGLSVG